MLVELSVIDNGCADLGLCRGFVYGLPGADGLAGDRLVEAVRAATQGVARQWTLLQGRPVWLSEKRLWAIRVPDDVDEARLPAPTTERVDQAYHEAIGAAGPLEPLSPTSRSGQVHPFLTAHFRHPKTPSTFKEHAKTGHPLLSVHITLFQDAVALGVSAPHGLFDGTGLAQVLAGISAALHGEEWLAPPTQEANPLSEARTQLILTPSHDDGGDLAAGQPPLLSGWTAFSALALLSLLLQAAWDHFWHKDSLRYAFIGGDSVDSLVNEVKHEVKNATDGKEWVSTGDIMTAWVLKNLHGGDSTSRGSVSCSLLYNMRSLLSSSSPGLAPNLARYTGNAVVPYPLGPTSIPLAHLATMSTGALALLHRRTLAACKTLTWLRAMLLASEAATQGGKVPLLPRRDFPWIVDCARGTTRWVVSNHMGAFADLRIPRGAPGVLEGEGSASAVLPLLAYYRHVTAPLNLNGAFALQRSDKGVFLVASARKARWKSLMAAIERLDKRTQA